jgi:hypothetical protein
MFHALNLCVLPKDKPETVETRQRTDAYIVKQ